MVKRTANSLTSQLVRPDSGSAILLDGTILNQGDLDSTGGEGGVRTPGRGFSPYNGLANRRIQPLCHLSADGSAEENRPNVLSIALKADGKREQFLTRNAAFEADHFTFFCVQENGSVVSERPTLAG